jgi:hypothetical protein
MGCILGCFERDTNIESKIYSKNYICVYSEFYIDYYLASRFDLWD